MLQTSWNQQYLEYLNRQYRFSLVDGKMANYLRLAAFLIIPATRSKGATLFFILAVIGLLLLFVFNLYREGAALRQVAMQGKPVAAFLVQANAALYQKGWHPALPGLVVFSFERPIDLAFLAEISEKMGELKGSTPENPMLKTVAGFTDASEERAVKYRRRLLPAAFTDGVAVYVADLQMDRELLRDGYLADPILPCLAVPGESGALELLPWQVLAPDIEE